MRNIIGIRYLLLIVAAVFVRTTLLAKAPVLSLESFGCASCKGARVWPLEKEGDPKFCTCIGGDYYKAWSASMQRPFSSRRKRACKLCFSCKASCEQCGLCDLNFTHLNQGGATHGLMLKFEDSAGRTFTAKTAEFASIRGLRLSMYATQFVLPVNLISSECGLSHMLPQALVGNLHGFLKDKGSGKTVQLSASNVIYEQFVQGQKLSQFLKDNANGASILDASQIVHAAIFDYLFGHCDHTSANILVHGSNIVLIDNYHQILGKYMVKTSWEKSVFLRRNSPLYFKCHAGGAGVALPTQLVACLNRIVYLDSVGVRARYSLPDLSTAQFLKFRAKNILSGFEQATNRLLGYKDKQGCEI